MNDGTDFFTMVEPSSKSEHDHKTAKAVLSFKAAHWLEPAWALRGKSHLTRALTSTSQFSICAKVLNCSDLQSYYFET